MIVYDLKCGKGHVFEAWFGSSADYEQQKKKRLLECPLCGDQAVEKAVMAPNVAAKSNQRVDDAAARAVTAPGGHSPEEVKQLLAKLAEMQRQVEENFEYVGEEFAEEARRIHFGEAEERSIYGEVSLAEAKELHEEGVDIMPLPFPSRRKRLNT